MKQIYSVVLVVFFFVSCSEGVPVEVFNIKSSFDSPFPKRTKNLTWKLGDEFSIKRGGDTLDFKVAFNKEDRHNFIIQEQTNDTVFAGTVSKYKGLYYFNRQLNDTAFWIYAVEIGGGTIRGLQSEWFQMKAWDDMFSDLLVNPDKAKNVSSAVLKSFNIKKSLIRLTPEPKAMRKFYESIIYNLPADTIISRDEIPQNSTIEKEMSIKKTRVSEAAEVDIIEKIYPNPATDNITLVLVTEGTFRYEIYNLNSRKLKNGLLKHRTNIVNISNFASGMYLIKVYDAANNRVETLKLTKE